MPTLSQYRKDRAEHWRRVHRDAEQITGLPGSDHVRDKEVDLDQAAAEAAGVKWDSEWPARLRFVDGSRIVYAIAATEGPDAGREPWLDLFDEAPPSSEERERLAELVRRYNLVHGDPPRANP